MVETVQLLHRPSTICFFWAGGKLPGPGSAAARANWQLACCSKSMSKIIEATRDHLALENFAFPKERKEPIHDAAHVRNAIARFKQVQGVTEAERDAAWKQIKSAAKRFGVELNERDWRELG